MAFETLTEPSYDEPEEPDFPLKMMDGVGDTKTEDPEYEIKLITDAAKFEMVKEKLGKHFATQAWIR